MLSNKKIMIQAAISIETHTVITALAQDQKRSISNMVGMLLDKAIESAKRSTGSD